VRGSGKIKFQIKGASKIVIAETAPPPVNQQNLDIRSTPREEMRLYPLDTFLYEFVGREIHINFEIPEFTACLKMSATLK
jgi:hypothetical protein